MSTSGLPLYEAALDDVPPRVLYELLKLRVDVFVVEQECAYPELDGRDLEPDALLLWAQDAAGRVAGTLRLLRDPDGTVRIGRVATAREARGQGVAADLMTRALELAGDVEVVLGAQAHLEHWYGRFGFAVDGPGYDEDGIAHVPMRRPAPGA
ncbi:GNAT family N-acetyltransferase [Paenibacillus sp. TRM 82003]|uniref:GNAT family N-acetyltransferase n=1 Tax=Kineococcus sp. TRM81007 TaxID=2925831 RepID=UPI001F5A7607|nr:GNAT family N-acetyltransferase [Kineococcus sp. TRM81007]MCI2237179.1 GNAT family N-acetyltransferase [Kineococcus sp. TRM81007]MCI3925300.1 GNAT family N-acetyltransferase [Paenibacillus sp. TRM 82003]